MKRYADEVILCFDSDEAGQNAAVRSLDHLLASGMAVRVAVVPAPHDPDSFIKESGAVAFRKLIEEADGFFDYYLNRLCALNEVTTDKGRLTILRGMAEAVCKTGSPVLIDKHAQKTALRLGVSSDAVRAEFKKAGRGKSAPVEQDPDPAPDEPAEAQRPSAHEYWLLKLLLLHEDLVPWSVEFLDPRWIPHTRVREIVTRRLDAQQGQTWTNLAAFLDGCQSADERNLVTEAATEERPIPNPQQQLADVVTRLRNQSVDRQLMALIHQANQPETNDGLRIELLRQQQELRALKRQPLHPQR